MTRTPGFHSGWKVKIVLVTQSCLTVCKPMDCSPPGSVHGCLQARILGMGCRSLLQGIFLHLGLLHCRQILYCLSHQGNPSFRLPRLIPGQRIKILLHATTHCCLSEIIPTSLSCPHHPLLWHINVGAWHSSLPAPSLGKTRVRAPNVWKGF